MTEPAAAARDRSIASLVTIGLVSAITLLFSFAGLVTYQSYRAEQLALLHARHATLADQLALGLASPLWNFDRPTLAKLADGALRDDIISGLSVRLADDGTLLDARVRDAAWRHIDTKRAPVPSADELVEERPIVFDEETIGTLQVIATTRFVEHSLATTRLYLVCAIFGFDVVLILALYALLRRLVLVPLRGVERFAQAVSSSPTDAKPKAPRHLRGELGSLQASLERMIDHLQAAYVQLRDWHHQLERTKDEERRVLSRELHDELGQALTALKLRLKMLSNTGGAPQPGTIEDAVALVDELIAAVRKISVGLRPPLLDELGLESAVRAFVESLAPLTTTSLVFEARGLAARLSPELEMASFRIVQEAVTNVLRHAAAQSARVSLVLEGDRLVIVVQDDGIGVSEEHTLARARAGHLGIVGMRERAGALGGTIELSSPPVTGEPRGTRMEVRLPVVPVA